MKSKAAQVRPLASVCVQDPVEKGVANPAKPAISSVWIGTTVCFVVLALFGAATPATAYESANGSGAAQPAMTAKEEQEAAKEASRKYLVEGRDRASANLATRMAAADRFVQDALARRQSAQAAHSNKKTLANFRRLTQAASAYTQAVAVAKGMRIAADFTYLIEKRAVEGAAEMTVYPANARVAVEANLVPAKCADPYLASVRSRVAQFISALEALDGDYAGQFEAASQTFQHSLAVLYQEEIDARVAYERARMAHAARPTKQTKNALDYAKSEMQGAIRVAAYDAKDAQRAHLVTVRDIGQEGRGAVLVVERDERSAARKDGEALSACVLEQ